VLFRKILVIDLENRLHLLLTDNGRFSKLVWPTLSLIDGAGTELRERDVQLNATSGWSTSAA
jgi:hypothetical protein